LLVDGSATLSMFALPPLLLIPNQGLITLTSQSAVLAGSPINNTGTIQGQGRITNPISINTGTIRAEGGQLTMAAAGSTNNGTIEVPTGATVFFTQGLEYNDALIALAGGAFDSNNHQLMNTGSILGHGTLRGGLLNRGIFHVADGATNVFGGVYNDSSGTFIQEGSESTITTFYGLVTNQPGGTFQVLGGTVRFLGGVSGEVGMSNAGAMDLAAGSAAVVQNGNGVLEQTDSSKASLNLGDNARLTAKTLKIQDGTLSADGPNARITANLEYTSPENSEFAGVLAGAGKTLTLNSPDVLLTMSGQNTYTGNTTVLAGTLDLTDLNTPAATVTVAAGDNALIAQSITTNTLTIGAGAKVVIKPLPGGSLAGMNSLKGVPEPSTWAMLVLAAMGLSIYRRHGRYETSLERQFNYRPNS
jgi:autotransporter-associated beta strand protein